MTETRQVSIDEAARIFGLSRRTIERRLTDGRLTGHRQGVRWLVDVPVTSDTTTPLRASRDRALEKKVADLTHAVELVSQERDAATSERDYLRQALAAALTVSQRLLPESALGGPPAVSTSTPRHWWQFWR